ncbi:unnamed protein product [Chondrus crispus]|uniref:Transmembrane protein 208 n=1 Tax=Chondrus crispus TaxID=2769 RepID=R7Q2R0_CHOCR|nr:unnamed protein product [Chondrus crispus]CDF32324.1 unnamed protein product [Chondrus crispus]|eukprot:XP_005711989.1 unnamed protein product [Chondrus crispus]
MANSSAKKRVKSNSARLTRLRLLIVAANLIYIVVRLLLPRSAVTTFHLAAWFFLLLTTLAPFYLLWTAARPRYFDDGQLCDGGEDISAPGVLEYAHDTIYISLLTLLALLLTKWALLIFAVLPTYAIYASCAARKAPNEIDAEEDQAVSQFAAMSRKERRKAERASRKVR